MMWVYIFLSDIVNQLMLACLIFILHPLVLPHLIQLEFKQTKPIL